MAEPALAPAAVVEPPKPAADPAPAPAPAAVEPSKPAAVEPAPTLLGAEPKPAEPKPGEPKPAEPAPAAFDAAKLTLSEGFVKDDKLLGEFGKIAGELKLSQDGGQKLLDLYSGAVKQVGDANTKAWNDTKTEWEGKVKADTEIGGDKLQPTLQQISKALDSTLGTDGAKAFKQAMDITGAGSHPAVVKALSKFAAILTEGKHIPGSPGKGEKDLGQLFFPNSPDMKG